ncbi:hypothetical protein [Halalkalibacter alkalisediminis]|uniref:Pore-forming protein n=1 Tax=Halalkalibacter alkalisediminis TaxID=935616 RepID=A0ABV6NFH6_9BACI|nr:hypothetical protein [Halalkalibacter alkalisediminis]
MYRANEPKFLWVLLFILTITYAYAFENPILTYVAYGLSFLFFTAMTLSYQVEVRERDLVRTISVFGFPIKKQIIQADEMEKFEIIEVGDRQIVLLYLKKKMRIKLHRFSPDGLPESLATFATENNIPKIEKGSR